MLFGHFRYFSQVFKVRLYPHWNHWAEIGGNYGFCRFFFWCFCKWGSMNYSPTWLRCRWGWSSLPLPCCWLRLPWPRPLNGAVGNARTTNGLCLVVQVCLSNQNGYIVIWRCIAYNDVLPPNKSPTSGPQKILNSPGCRGLLLWKGNQTCLLVKSQKSCCSNPTFSRGREGQHLPSLLVSSLNVARR